MENKEVIESLKKHETLLDKIHKKLFAKNLMLQDVNGVEIDFGDAVETPEQIAVGVEAKVDGKPANDVYTIPIVGVVKIVEGKVESIEKPQTEDVEALKAELEALKAEKATTTEAQNKLQKEFDDFKASAESQLTQAKTEFKAFKAQYSKEPPAGNAPSSVGETTNRVAKYLKKE